MDKRGEKSLQMIFGLFMLLIISLVVLAMFFQFVRRGGDELNTVSSEYALQASKEKAIADCQSLCDNIGGQEGVIDFCSQAYSVDWDGDGFTEGAMTNGQWWACEKKVPCFVLVPNCKNRYTGNKCRAELAEYREDLYRNLWLNVDDDRPGEVLDPIDPATSNPADLYTQPTGGHGDYSDGCILPTSQSSLAPGGDGLPKTKYNWKERFCFNRTVDAAWNGDPCDLPI